MNSSLGWRSSVRILFSPQVNSIIEIYIYSVAKTVSPC